MMKSTTNFQCSFCLIFGLFLPPKFTFVNSPRFRGKDKSLDYLDWSP